jgi:carbon storage regulator CsrA
MGMLTITRRVGEETTLTLPDGTEIVIVLMTMKRGQARIGISAPLSVRILRHDAIVKTPKQIEEQPA